MRIAIDITPPSSEMCEALLSGPCKIKDNPQSRGGAAPGFPNPADLFEGGVACPLSQLTFEMRPVSCSGQTLNWFTEVSCNCNVAPPPISGEGAEIGGQDGW